MIWQAQLYPLLNNLGDSVTKSDGLELGTITLERYLNTETAASWAPNPQHDSAHASMTHDNTSIRVFRIGELTRVIASQLILISQASVVNLACTCRCLEEPVLSTLWEIQQSLPTLLKVLPKANWQIDGAMRDYTVRGLYLPVEGPNA